MQNQTKSLWSFANHNRDLFLNPLYHGDVRSNDLSGKEINTALYGYWGPSIIFVYV